MTVEEKAEKYAIDFVKSRYRDIYSVDAKFAFNAVKHDWLAGHAEAIRWRDPEKELPEKDEIKIKRDDVVDYVNASLLAEDDGSLFFGDYNFVIFIKLKDVIGWRPIE